MLEAAGPDFANVVEFQSLSKRSNLPGLRIGFAAGDRNFLARFLELRNVAAPQVPMPAQRVAIAAYGDETHVEENRRLYSQKFDLADQIIGDRYGYRRPAGGFFLWLDVTAQGGDEAVALRLWKEAGLRVVPGRYLARDQADGSNPGLRLHPRRHRAGPGDHRGGAASPRRGARLRGHAMRAIDRGLEGFLPDGLREALRRRLRELGGVALILLAILLALALASWSVQDPSLSHATNAPIRNVLGFPGAIVADLLMQLFGVAALAFVLPVAVWGWRLASHRPLRRERIRLIFWILGVLLATAFASCLPRSATWPLPAGLGGVIGDGLLRLPILLAGAGASGVVRMGVAVASGIGALVSFAIASGFGWQGRRRRARRARSSRTKDAP